MLVLTRKKGEGIRIGELGRVTILEVTGSRVRIGIECPAHVPIHREEIYQRIQALSDCEAVEPESCEIC